MSKLHSANSLVPSLPAKLKVLLIQKTLEKQKLNFFRCALFNMKTRDSLKYFVSYCRSNYKTTLIKTKNVDIYHGINNFGNNGYIISNA